MKSSYKYIVVGAGGSIGSAAVYWLSRDYGDEVLGLEQFEFGHSRGEGDDHSRIIRLSYHDPKYTALTPHAYTAWHEVEAESGEQLVIKTGGLDLDSNMEYLKDAAQAMDNASVPYEWLSPDEVRKRWPAFKLPEDMGCIYQADSGIVDARRATATHIKLAKARGATIMSNTPVRSIELSNGVAKLITADKKIYEAEKLIIAAGPWTKQLLRPLGFDLPLKVTKEQVVYYKTPRLEMFAPDSFPIWLMHYKNSEHYYGFPAYGETATKAGIHMGGKVVTADTRTFEPDPRITQSLEDMLQKYLPDFLGPIHYEKTCLYTLTPDQNFIVDTLPNNPNVAVVLGAGHAFKFASLLGKILAQLAAKDSSEHLIEGFRITRPALTDPEYKPKEEFQFAAFSDKSD